MIRKILLIGFCVIILIGCSSKNTQQTPVTTVSTYPGPVELPTIPAVNTAYPEPNDAGNGQTSGAPIYFVTGLVVPTPNSGKAVVTGKLLGSGADERPFLTSIYLATASPAQTSGASPEVKYSEHTDPIAVQDTETGQFVFSNAVPGQYALVIWSQNGGIPLLDESGNTIIFVIDSGEVKDLGSIHVP